MKFFIWFFLLLLAPSNFVLGGKRKNEKYETGMNKRSADCPVKPRGALYMVTDPEETALTQSSTMMCSCSQRNHWPNLFGRVIAMVERESGIHLYDEILTANESLKLGKSSDMPGAYIDYQAFDKWKITFAEGGKIRFVFWKKIDSSYKAVIDIIFDGKGSDPINWFSIERVLEIIEGPNVAYSDPTFFDSWSVKGHMKEGHYQRNFYISHWDTTCESSSGMIFTIERSEICTHWLNDTSSGANRAFPRFGYSTTGFICVWNQKHCWDEADILAIYVMM